MTLPIDAVLPDICAALVRAPNLVLQAPPGAGKTTRVPLALLDAEWLAGRKIVVLEPRRLAARTAARFMAAGLHESAGETVGYRVRLDSKVSAQTRVELVTDGLFLRRLQADPGLDGIGAVLFDEVHERSLEVDLALALCLEAQGALRPDLRLVAMSATLEGAALAQLMRAATVTSEGRAFPVDTRWLGRPEPRTFIEDAVAAAVRRALGDSDSASGGDMLVFLPGAGEIRRTAERLGARALPPGTHVAPLYGDLDLAAQEAAIRPSPPGERKIVLATAIAETSLTIEGVRVVVDSGLARIPRFEPASGMTRLETVRVSQASAEQRRGRAGRVAPGICYRLWSEAEHKSLAQYPTPEIREADLAPLALELAVWGARDAAKLAWLDPPPAQALAQARELLERLGALDAGGAVTAHGRAMAGFGAHPRLAHMMIAGKAMGAGALACDLAALIEERDLGRELRSIDIRLRLGLLEGRGGERIRRVAEMWRRQLKAEKGGKGDAATGRLLALAYPDRVAQRRGDALGSFRLANGRGAWCDEGDPLARSPFLAIADLDGDKQEARIFRAAPLARADLDALFGARIRAEEQVQWDAREQAVKARKRTTLDALVLSEAPFTPDPAAATSAVLDGIRELGLTALPWPGEAESLRARIALLRRIDGADAGWPDVSDHALIAGLADWLGPFLGGIARRGDFGCIPLARALESLLDWKQKQRLDREAPVDIAVPSGRRLRIDYVSGPEPILAVRIQEMFGATATPAIAGGRVPLLLHLLSPAQRPIQVTRDLVSFWRRGYPEARGDLRGRYPKHYWPDDPLKAQPTSRVRPR